MIALDLCQPHHQNLLNIYQKNFIVISAQIINIILTICYFPANIRLDEDVLKTSWRRLDQEEYVRLSLTSLEDVFKTSSRRFQDILPRRLQDVLKTSSRRLAKISSRHFQDISSSSTVFVNMSLRSIQHVSETFFSKDDYLQREGYALVTLLLINLWSVCKICKRNKNFSSYSFSIYYTF